MPTTIVVFHQDLRVGDHGPLAKAAERGSVVPVYIHDEQAGRAPGAASRWWLQAALGDLARSLAGLGAPLILRRGRRLDVIRSLIKAAGAEAVFWHRRYEPALAAQDEAIAEALRAEGVAVEIFDGFLLYDPASIRTGAGKPFRVFTPFSRACFAAETQPSKPIAAPRALKAVEGLASETLESWRLVPKKAVWPQGLAQAWRVSEAAARDLLQGFLKNGLKDYAQCRDLPAVEGTSRLSPYLHFGQISVRQVWYAVQTAKAAMRHDHASIERYLLEVLWREFSWHLLEQFPVLATEPLQSAFIKFPWRTDEPGLAAWQLGRTGYPIVDAGMRQLWQTGWMHNRVRMIVASFLIKHLLIDWRKGEAWFWDTLVDADLGANAASWQWVAGCGADAAPYFRIFNPVLQGQKFDPDGVYIRRYVPELEKLDSKYIHEPWKAPASVLAAAGYPTPMVEHNFARKRALAALAASKGVTPEPGLFG